MPNRMMVLRWSIRVHIFIFVIAFLPLRTIGESLPADAKPLRIEISREHPLIIWQSTSTGSPRDAEVIVDNWINHLPDDLKPYSVFQVEIRDLNLERRYERQVALLDVLQEAGVPVCLQVIDPHPEYAIPLRYVARLIEKYDCIYLVHSVENRTEFYTKIPEAADLTAPTELHYMSELIKLGARHGLATSMQHQALRWLHIATDELAQELRETLKTYHAYVIPANEHLGSQHFPRQTSVLGFWLGGVTDHWGVEPQSWWWQNANFTEPGVFGRCPDAWHTKFPKGLYRPMILQAAMLGATVYGFEPFWDLFENARPDVWHEDILPTMREVIHRGLISTKDDVLERAKLAYQVPESKSIADFHRISRDMDWMADEGLLARAAYGVYARGIQHELIPNRNRAFFIPILPLNAEESARRRFQRVIGPGECDTQEDYEHLLEELYPEPDREPAYVERVGRFMYVMQTHENLYERQAFSVDVPVAVHGIEASREGDTLTMRWPPVKGAESYEVCRWIHERMTPDDFPVGSEWTRWETLADVAQPEFQVNVSGNAILGVRATTTTRETLSGHVNFLDCLVFDTACSRIEEIVELSAETREAGSRPRRFVDRRPESQEWFDLGAGLSPEHRSVADEVKAELLDFISYFEGEDIRGLAPFYARDYRDPNGYGRDYSLRAWLWWFQRMEFPYCAATVQEWDTSGYESTGIVRFKMVGFWRGVIVWDEPWGYDGFARLPRHDSLEVWWSWKRNPASGRWEIVATEPACPNFGEMLWNSRDHTHEHSMEAYRDGPKPW